MRKGSNNSTSVSQLPYLSQPELLHRNPTHSNSKPRKNKLISTEADSYRASHDGGRSIGAKSALRIGQHSKNDSMLIIGASKEDDLQSLSSI